MAAILLGLEGCQPETIDTHEMERRLLTVRSDGKILFGGRRTIPLTEEAMVFAP